MTRRPSPPSMTVREARDAYLAENGFTLEAYDAKWTDGSILGLRVRVPNTWAHRAGIMLHDLNHVVTGFGTDHTGEGEISAWEVRRGLRGLGAYVGGIVLSGAALGLLLAPRATVRAWRASGRGAGSLFPIAGLPKAEFERRYAALLDRSVSELRRELCVPQGGVAEGPRRLHAYAPRAVA